MALLTGKRALVSGVANSKSIALGIAQAFHEQGARVALTCLESTQRRVAKIAGDLGPAAVIACDVTKDDDVARAFAQVTKEFDGKLDILVHSIATARLEDLRGEFLTVTREGWHLALDVSAYSLVAMARAARPLMKAAGGGSILALSFAGGDRVSPGYNIMGVAKAALECTVRYLAYDLGPDGIRVNALSPSAIPTMSAMMIEYFEEIAGKSETHSPLLRAVTPRDVGNAAVLYASDICNVITGATIPVDGGMNTLAASAGVHPRSRRPEAQRP